MEEGSRRILIVDDDLSLCAILSDSLSSLGECATAGSAAAAIEALQKETFGLVLTDIRMPGMSGLELCEYVRGHYPKTAVIVMSMHTSKPYEAASIRRGAFGFLPKPFDTTLLLEMVGDALSWRGNAPFPGARTGKVGESL
jgi:DNA-binding NtrC family response regulator